MTDLCEFRIPARASTPNNCANERPTPPIPPIFKKLRREIPSQNCRRRSGGPMMVNKVKAPSGVRFDSGRDYLEIGRSFTRQVISAPCRVQSRSRAISFVLTKAAHSECQCACDLGKSIGQQVQSLDSRLVLSAARRSVLFDFAWRL